MSPVRLDLLHSFNQPWQTDTNMLALLNHMCVKIQPQTLKGLNINGKLLDISGKLDLMLC